MAIRIHDEIKQSAPFPRRESEAFVSILRTAAVIDHALDDALKPYGLTRTQYNVLRILQGAAEPGLCGREIAERLISPVPDVSRLLDRMVEAQLISRERDVSDQRQRTARITARGLQLLEQVDPLVTQIELNLFGRLGEDELCALIAALDHVRAAV
jgi:DNA-binding MarR family transcriptional regulator